MPNADAVTIFSYEERKAAVKKAAQLIASTRGFEEEREFELLTQAIVEFDISQDAQEFIEIPPAFRYYLRGTDRPAEDIEEPQLH